MGLSNSKSQHQAFFSKLRAGQIEDVHDYLKKGFNVNAKDDYHYELSFGDAALHIACRSTQPLMVELLLKFKANVNLLSTRGETPLIVAAQKGCCEILEMLISAGARINQADPFDQKTPLHFAVVNSHRTAVLTLVTRGADVNAVDKDALGPLYYAMRNGDMVIATILLDNGADIFARAHGGTLLHRGCSAIKADRDAIDLLLVRGADVRALDEAGNTPLHLVSNEIIAELLIRREASVNARNRILQTPLHTNSNPAVIAVLLANGANPAAVDAYGNTCLHEYALRGYFAAAEVLLRTAGVAEMVIDAVNKDSQTPLHVAVGSNAGGEVVTLVQALIYAGAPLHAVDVSNRTPRDVANQLHRSMLSALLKIAVEQENRNIFLK